MTEMYEDMSFERLRYVTTQPVEHRIIQESANQYHMLAGPREFGRCDLNMSEVKELKKDIEGNGGLRNALTSNSTRKHKNTK